MSRRRSRGAPARPPSYTAHAGHPPPATEAYLLGDRWELRARQILCPLCARGVPLSDDSLIGRRAHETRRGAEIGAVACGYEDGTTLDVGLGSVTMSGPEFAAELRAAFEAGRKSR